jgi:hypothetical protein
MQSWLAVVQALCFLSLKFILSSYQTEELYIDFTCFILEDMFFFSHRNKWHWNETTNKASHKCKELTKGPPSQAFPSYLELTTHAITSTAHRLNQVNLRTVKQLPTPLAYFTNWKRDAETKGNVSLLFYMTYFFFYCCFERTCIAVMNLNITTISSASGWCFTTRQSLCCPVLSSEYVSVCVRERREEVAGGGVRRTSLRLVSRYLQCGNSSFQNKQKHRMKPEFVVYFFKTYINHVRGPDGCVRRAESGPLAVVWRALI